MNADLADARGSDLLDNVVIMQMTFIHATLLQQHDAIRGNPPNPHSSASHIRAAAISRPGSPGVPP
jgi:hypothetical protein